MKIKITEFDLSQPAFTLNKIDLAGYEYLQVLVRYKKTPIQYAWVKLIPDFPPTTQELGLEIISQLQRPIMMALLRTSLMAVQPQKAIIADSELPVVTVVIPTRNRPESLALTLNSLTQIDYPPEKLDLLVVDNAPLSDSTKKLVHNFNNIRYIMEPRPGLEWARNRGIREARGEIVSFTDDDVEVDKRWIRAIVPHLQNPEISGVTGLVAPGRRDTEAENIFEEWGGHGKGFQRKYFAKQLEKYKPFPLSAGIVGTGANMAFRKQSLVNIGGFDPVLGAGSLVNSAGDLDMLYRLLRNGNKIVYEPEALIWHYHRSDLESLERQLYNYGRGVYALFTKSYLTDPEMRGRVLKFAPNWFLKHFLLEGIKLRGIQRKLRLKQAKGALEAPVRYIQSIKRKKEIITRLGPLDLEKI